MDKRIEYKMNNSIHKRSESNIYFPIHFNASIVISWMTLNQRLSYNQAQLFWAKAQNKIKKPNIRILKSPK